MEDVSEDGASSLGEARQAIAQENSWVEWKLRSPAERIPNTVIHVKGISPAPLYSSQGTAAGYSSSWVCFAAGESWLMRRKPIFGRSAVWNAWLHT